MKCVQMSWMVILVGPASVGKTSLVQLLAHLTGHTLKIMAMNSAMDTTELLGGFEQVSVTLSHFQIKHCKPCGLIEGFLISGNYT